MQWNITRTESPPLIRIKVSGTFEVAKCSGIFNEIAEVKGSNPFFPILIDDREADLSELGPADLIDLGNLYLKSQAIFAYSKIALLMNPGPDFDTATKFQRMTEGNAIVTFDVFSSEDKALSWIKG